MKFISSMLLSIVFSLALQAQWTQTSGPAGGSVFRFLSYGDILYAGANNGGIYSTNDGGNTWVNCNSPVLSVSSLAANNSSLFVCGRADTVLRDPQGMPILPNLVFKSNNGGRNWQLSFSLSRLTVGVSSLLAIGDTILATSAGGIYRSMDNGDTWQRTDSSISFTGFGAALHRVQNRLYAVGSRILSSGDWGATWTLLTAQFSNAVTLGSLDTILFVVGSGGISRSTDNGRTWQLINNGLTNPERIEQFSVIGDTIYVGGFDGIFTSVNRGDLWQPLPTGIPETQPDGLGIHRGKLYVSHQSRGVASTRDNGNTWQPIQTLPIAETVSLHVSGNEVFAGTRGNGVFSTKDNGRTWQPRNLGLSLHRRRAVTPAVMSLTNSGNSLFCTIAENIDNPIVYRSLNSGETWQAASAGIPMRGGAGDVVSRGNLLFASYLQLYRSSDGGNTWQATSPDTIGGKLLLVGNTLIASNNITGGSLKISEDNGQTWTNSNTQLPWVISLATLGNVIFAGTQFGIYRSTDMGRNWQWVTREINMRSVPAMVSVSNIVFATSNAQVWLSADTGNTWRNTGNLGASVTSLAVNNGELYAGTVNGVWKAPLARLSVSSEVKRDLSKTFLLFQNYPNPFNPSTIISYQLPMTSNVSLKVYDILGRELVTLVNQRQSAGVYQVDFNATRFASGVYFYRLTANENSEIRKMMLMK